jgi:hypothetical protein
LTTFENKSLILSDLWLNFRDEEAFEDFIKYNDLALPFAFALSEGLISQNEPGVNTFIEDAWKMLLAILKVDDEEKDYESLTELFDDSIEKTGWDSEE